MNILQELTSLITGQNLRVETGIFKDKAPDTYIVLIPLSDSYPLNADDGPLVDLQECRISIFSKSNYLTIKKTITNLMITNGICVTARTFNGFDTGSGYYQYSIDVAKNYNPEDI